MEVVCPVADVGLQLQCQTPQMQKVFPQLRFGSWSLARPEDKDMKSGTGNDGLLDS